MATLGELTAQRSVLEAARGKAEKRVTWAGRTVEKRSTQEILDAIEAIDREIAALAATPARSYRLTSFKGAW